MKEIKKVGEQVKEAREKVKMTQKYLAESVGLSSKSAVYNIESGRTTVSVNTLTKIATLLKTKFVIHPDPV